MRRVRISRFEPATRIILLLLFVLLCLWYYNNIYPRAYFIVLYDVKNIVLLPPTLSDYRPCVVAAEHRVANRSQEDTPGTFHVRDFARRKNVRRAMIY